eukprot:c14680_g1_i1.p1 GENE.c14680_g1_i1~~c14680_g1_i1.p1  ORF type:complete len:296 (+),score=61.64 c14680_g1_i1:895-1782(+)
MASQMVARRGISVSNTNPNPFDDPSMLEDIGALSNEAIELATSSPRYGGGIRMQRLRLTPRGQLLQFLKESAYYDVPTLRSIIPGDTLHEEKVFLCSKSGEHSSALRTLAWALKDEAWAHWYCLNQTPALTPEPEAATNLLLMLLKTYLLVDCGGNNDPNKPTKPMEGEARRLLDLRGKDMNPADVIRAFPPQTSLSYLAPFLKKVIPVHTARMREASIVKALSKVELMSQREKLIRLSNRCVEIQSNKKCGVCQNNIGTTAFAAYPNGVTVHYKCLRSTTICPMTGIVFTEYNS